MSKKKQKTDKATPKPDREQLSLLGAVFQAFAIAKSEGDQHAVEILCALAATIADGNSGGAAKLAGPARKVLRNAESKTARGYATLAGVSGDQPKNSATHTLVGLMHNLLVCAKAGQPLIIDEQTARAHADKTLPPYPASAVRCPARVAIEALRRADPPIVGDDIGEEDVAVAMRRAVEQADDEDAEGMAIAVLRALGVPKKAARHHVRAAAGSRAWRRVHKA